MILHGYFRSSTSYRLRIALNLKGIDYQRSPVNLLEGENREDAYLAINRFGTVPALVSDGTVRVQSLALLDWLEETCPNPSFFPSGREARQTCRELYYAVATEIHAVNNLPILKYLKAEFDADAHAIETWYETWIHRTFGPVEDRLSAHDWTGEELPFGIPTAFEIVLIPQIYNARRWDTDLSSFPLLNKIDAACSKIDAFKNAQPDIQSDAPGDS